DDTYDITFIPESMDFVLGNSLYERYNLQTLKQVGTIHHSVSAFSPNGKLFAYGFSDSIDLYDVETGDEVNIFPFSEPADCGYGCGFGSIAFSPNGSWIASSGSPTTIYDVLIAITTSERIIDIFVGPCSITFSHDGTLIASRECSPGWE